jgi:hypothetical protein
MMLLPRTRHLILCATLMLLMLGGCRITPGGAVELIVRHDQETVRVQVMTQRHRTWPGISGFSTKSWWTCRRFVISRKALPGLLVKTMEEVK